MSESAYAFSAYQSAGRTSPLYPCDILDVGPSFVPTLEVFAYQKDSPLTEIFNFYLKKLQESGVTNKIIDKHMHRILPTCSVGDYAIGFKTVLGMYGILWIGICMAGFIFVVEWIGGNIYNIKTDRGQVQPRLTIKDRNLRRKILKKWIHDKSGSEEEKRYMLEIVADLK